MTPAEFKQARITLGLKQIPLGEILGYGQQHISGMETGRVPIPTTAAIAMRAMLTFGLPGTWVTPPARPCTPPRETPPAGPPSALPAGRGPA